MGPKCLQAYFANIPISMEMMIVYISTGNLKLSNESRALSHYSCMHIRARYISRHTKQNVYVSRHPGRNVRNYISKHLLIFEIIHISRYQTCLLISSLSASSRVLHVPAHKHKHSNTNTQTHSRVINNNVDRLSLIITGGTHANTL